MFVPKWNRVPKKTESLAIPSSFKCYWKNPLRHELCIRVKYMSCTIEGRSVQPKTKHRMEGEYQRWCTFEEKLKAARFICSAQREWKDDTRVPIHRSKITELCKQTTRPMFTESYKNARSTETWERHQVCHRCLKKHATFQNVFQRCDNESNDSLEHSRVGWWNHYSGRQTNQLKNETYSISVAFAVE